MLNKNGKKEFCLWLCLKGTSDLLMIKIISLINIFFILMFEILGIYGDFVPGISKEIAMKNKKFKKLEKIFQPILNVFKFFLDGVKIKCT